MTKSYIKNITDRPQKYTAFFNWENGGMYIIGLKEIAPHQTIEIDVKDLRDRQVPDENGNVIPLHLSKGQFQWSLRPEEGEISETDPLSILALLGRSDQIDYTKEISNNYACENCCVNNPIGSRISPNSAEIEYGDSVTLRAQIAEETCTGVPFEYYEDVSNASWTTSDSSVASVSGGNVTGQGAGTTTIRASFSRSRRVAEPCGPGGPYLTGCLENQLDENSNKKEEEGEGTDEPPCGSCRYAGTYFANPSATVTVKPKVQISAAQNKKDGENATFSVTVQGGTPSSIQWSFEAPSGAGNNPQVNFDNPNAANVTAKAHWFALPNNACSASFDAEYDIKVRVRVANRDYDKETTLTVNAFWDPAGSVAPATITGGPTYGYNTATNLWVVVGPGSLQRVTNPAVINVPSTSQFYNKTVQHENKHVEQWNTGLFVDILKVSNLMTVLSPLTDATEQGLINKINAASLNWFNQEAARYNNLIPQAEREAYAISDLLAPQYLYQNCGRY